MDDTQQLLQELRLANVLKILDNKILCDAIDRDEISCLVYFVKDYTKKIYENYQNNQQMNNDEKKSILS